jgi:hexulose-6-phosphate isomerase
MAQTATKRPIKKAINLGMIGESGSIMDKFKLAKDLGFEGLEINRPGPEDLKELVAARDATGVAVAGIMNMGHWEKTLSDPNPDVRQQGVDIMTKSLKDAKELGAPSVLLVPAVVNAKVSYDDAYTRSQAEIRKLIPLATELKVKIAIENVWNQFLLSPLEAARYLDELNSPWVGWHFDVGNIVNYGWPEQWIRILNKRIANVHIKEFSRTKRDKQGLWAGFDVELLDGDCHWSEVMKALDNIHYSGFMIAEIGGGKIDRLKDIASRMDRILAS